MEYFGMIVAGIFIYPVKALRAVECESALVTARGLMDDRNWMLVDPDGKFITQRQAPALARLCAIAQPTGLELRDPLGNCLTVATPDSSAACLAVTIWRDQVDAKIANGGASEFIRAATGVICHLVHLPLDSVRKVDPRFGQPGDQVSFADAYPLLLSNEDSLNDLNRKLKNPVPMTRFRPNLVLRGAPAWDEDGWRRLKIGEVILEVVKPCDRCAVTTIDQQTGLQPDGSEPLRTLARFRRDAQNHVIFGQNAIARELGVIRVGDRVEILESEKKNLLF